MERLARNYPFALCSSYFSKPEGGSRKHRPMSVAGSVSDLGARSCEVRFTPMSRPRQLNRFRPKSANNGRDLCWIKMHMARSGDIPGVTVTGLQNRLRILQLGEGD